MNSISERFVKSVRNEALDNFIITERQHDGYYFSIERDQEYNLRKIERSILVKKSRLDPITL